jgi:Spy/CpxP family protein refolding chaperone
MNFKFLFTIAFICMIFQVNAQKDRFPKGQKRGQSRAQGEMMKDLQLSDSQLQKIKVIRKDRHDQLAELEKNDKISLKEYRSKKAVILKENKKNMESVLTPEQKAKISQKKQERQIGQETKADYRLKMMRSRLGLSDKQFEEISKEQKRVSETRKKIMANENLLPEQKKSAVKDLRQSGRSNMEQVLSTEQLEKWKELRNKEGNQERRGSSGAQRR